MSTHTKKTQPSGATSCFFWWVALLVLLVCSYLLFTQIQTAIRFQQQGIVVQSTIVATSPCSIPNRQPDSSTSQQGVLLTLRFVDERGHIDTVTFPGCQQGTYRIGDPFPVRYLPDDSTTLARATPGYTFPDIFTLTFCFLGIGILLSGVLVIRGVLRLLEHWKLIRVFARQAHIRQK